MKDDRERKIYLETKYSHFISYELREDFEDFYSFNWQINSISLRDQNRANMFRDAMTPQSQNAGLVFSFDEVLNQVSYKLNLRIEDTHSHE